MDILKLRKMNNEDCPRMRMEMVEAVAAYRDIMNNQNSTRDDIQAACNNAIRKMVDVIDIQTDLINGLIISGQYMGELLTGKEPANIS